jgi:hypothetical protein
MRQPNTNPNRLKYKVYRVVNVRTGKVSRLAGVGMELPHEVLRNLPLGCEWAGKIKGGDTMRYERIL